MDKRTLRILVVDDYEAWRRYICSTIQEQPELHVIAEVADGLEAVQVAEKLQPDLILLDVGLPTLNGVEAARRIRESSPTSKIVFVSENRSWDIAEEALRTGGAGYVVKSSAASELLPAIAAVLQGKQFVSASLTGPRAGYYPRRDNVEESTSRRDIESPYHHEAAFYSDDQSLLDGVATFIGPVLEAGNAAIVVATESHRHSLVSRLQAQGLDIDAAIEQGRYIALDVIRGLSMFMVNDMPDPVRFLEAFRNLIVTTAQAAKGSPLRVAFYGEGSHVLWVEGQVEAAIQTERLSNQLSHSYDVDILCGYSLSNSEMEMDQNVFQQICAEHSAVYSR